MKGTLFSSAIVAISLSTAVYAGPNCHKEASANNSGAVKEAAIKTGHDKEAIKSRIKEIKHDDLVTAIDEGTVILVDANGSESYSKGHIPGALNFEDTEALMAQLPEDKNAMIVAYCGGPKCSAWCKAAGELEEAGYTNLRYYKGGLKGWMASGKKLESKKKG